MTEKIFKIIYNELGRNPTESYPPMDKANLELILDRYYDKVEVKEITLPEPTWNYVIDYCTCKKSEPNPHNTSKCIICDKILNKEV